jgi:hypothetical protein
MARRQAELLQTYLIRVADGHRNVGTRPGLTTNKADEGKRSKEVRKNGAVRTMSETGTFLTALSQVVLETTLPYNFSPYNGTEVCIPLDDFLVTS